MDIFTMMTTAFDDDKNEEEFAMATDLQFKAFIRMTLLLAETTHDVKEFTKTFGGWTSWTGATGHFATYIWMIPKVAAATEDMNKVRQLLQEILNMQ